MINLGLGVLIDRPVSQVYAFLTNPLNLPRWQANVKDIKALSPGAAGVGSAFSVVSEMLGRRIEGRMEIVGMEPDRSFTFKMTAGPMHLQIKADFKTVGTGTKLALNAQAEPGGLFKLAEGALAGQVKSQMEANLARLKSVLESGA
jgi:carbon monoxide dehydrogenase subunit G